MLTPKFEISQSDCFIILHIHAPYTKVKDVELSVIDNLVSFYAKPYLLRLQFSNDVEEEGSSCEFDVDKGNYNINIKKTVRKEFFPNLDLITTLLCNTKSEKPSVSIEVLNSKVAFPEVDKKVSINWDKTDNNEDQCSYGYGFANKKHNVPVQETLQEVISLENPDKTSIADRRLLRIESEDVKFDSDHYFTHIDAVFRADLYEDEMVDYAMKFKPWWTMTDSNIIFTSDENAILQSLPNREYLLDDFETKTVFLGLVDILFGFAYNVRETEAENNVESSWSIRNISSTLSWFDTPSSLRHVLITSFRRLLSYPQHRNWKLAEKLKRDVITILQLGRRSVLRCLLNIHLVFRETDGSPCYLLNDLYITDYCVWLQKEDCDQVLTSLADALNKITLSKSDVGFEIDLLEEAARLVLDETPSDDSLHEQLVNELDTLTL